VQNTIDTCINSATDRRDYVLEHRFTKFSEITQCNGHYAVQGHSGDRFWYQSKAHIRLPISGNTNLPPILHRFQVMADYSSNFRQREGSASLQCSRWGWFPANIVMNDISLKVDFWPFLYEQTIGYDCLSLCVHTAHWWVQCPPPPNWEHGRKVGGTEKIFGAGIRAHAPTFNLLPAPLDVMMVVSVCQ